MKTLHLLMTIILGIVAISGINSVLGDTEKFGPEPKPVKDWLAIHPNFTGCVHTDLKTGKSEEVTCFHPEMSPMGMYVPTNPTHVTSPLKQFKSGTGSHNATCKEGLQLVIKSSDKSPACLQPHTAYQLINRGWAKEFVQSILDKSQSSACEGTLVPSGNPRTNTFPVLVMSTNSTATVCVTYNFVQDWNSYPNKNIYPMEFWKPVVLFIWGNIPHQSHQTSLKSWQTLHCLTLQESPVVPKLQ